MIINLKIIGNIYNVRVFAICQFVRSHKAPLACIAEKGEVNYYTDPSLFEDKNEELVSYVSGLLDRRAPKTNSTKRKTMVCACLSEDRYYKQLFGEKTTDGQPKTKKQLRISENTDGLGNPMCYEIRNYVNGSVSLFRWDDTAKQWIFEKSENNSYRKEEFIKDIRGEFKIR